MGGTHHHTDGRVTAAIKEVEAQVGAVLKDAREALRVAIRTSSKDTTVPTITLYVQEDIGIGASLKDELDALDLKAGALTGVFVPPSVKPGAKVNVILYIHGDKVRIWNQHGTIRDYWNLPQLPLRQGLSSSGQPFILVAPTLGKKAAAEFGNLGTDIDSHLDHVMIQLQKLGAPEFPLSKPPDIDQLIIAGHSGAYASIKSMLSSMKKYRGKIKEVWALDIMYQDLSSQLTALGVPVYAYFVVGSDTEDNSRKLAKTKNANIFVMENVDFETVKGNVKKKFIKHDNLMQRFWMDRCQRIGTNGTNPEDKKRMVTG